MKKRGWLLFLGIALGVGLAAALGFTYLQPYRFHGTLLQSPDPAPDFNLTSHTGQAVNLSDFRGKLVILYFGYTFCPDVCPATLAEVAGALQILGESAGQVQFMMISVDPERDTPRALGEYVAHFDPRFLGLSGSPEDIQAIATLFGIFFEKHAGSQATGYLVDHTATLMVIDQSGRLKLIFPFGTPAEDIASDLAYLLR